MELNEVVQLDKKHYLGVFGDRVPVCFVKGNGVTLWDTEGKSYTDFFGGIAVNSLGYGNKRVKKALHKQVDSLLHTSSVFYVENQARLAALLCENSCFDRVFFSNSGAEANEGAFKLAMKYAVEKGENRKKIVSARNSFHGRTMYTLYATGQEKFHAPFLPVPDHFAYVDFNDIAALEAAVDGQTCAVILETVQGEGGVLPATQEYLKAARDICTKHDVPLILDEVQTGLGRTGKLFSFMHYGIEPDIVTLAKALGGGVPIGAILAKEHVAQAFKKGDHGSTFGGNPLACAAGIAVMEELTQTDIIDRCNNTGTFFKKALEKLAKRCPSIKAVRGMGLMLGVEMAEGVKASDAVKKLLDKGFIVGTAGANTVRFVPPFIVTKKQVGAVVAALEDVLK